MMTQPQDRATWTERGVRQLLRLLRRPQALEMFPLACEIRDAVGAPSAYEGVVRVIATALSEYGRDGAQLYALIKRCDIEGTSTQTAIAYEMNLSSRQFFRYRAEAVRIIARFLQRLQEKRFDPIVELANLVQSADPYAALEIYRLDEHQSAPLATVLGATVRSGSLLDDDEVLAGDSHDALQAKAHLAYGHVWAGNIAAAQELMTRVTRAMEYRRTPNRANVEFELNLARFLLAQYSGAVRDMIEISRELRMQAQEHATLHAQAALCEGRAALHNGDFNSCLEAAEQTLRVETTRRDAFLLARALFLQAEGEFVTGEHAAAQKHALAARFALQRMRKELGECDMLLARLRLAGGMLPAQRFNAAFTHASHDLLFGAAIEARSLLLEGNLLSATVLAGNAAQDAARANYPALRAWSMVTVVATDPVPNGDAQAKLLEAWRAIAMLGDYYWARDAFVIPGLRVRDIGPLQSGGRFRSALGDVVAHAFPSWAVVQNTRALEPFTQSLNRMILDTLRGSTADTIAAAREIAAFLTNDGTSGAIFRRHQRLVASRIAYFVAILLPLEGRADFEERLRKAISEFTRHISQALE